jgi:hypothetical protein
MHVAISDHTVTVAVAAQIGGDALEGNRLGNRAGSLLGDLHHLS